jgi:hypothetical protein
MKDWERLSKALTDSGIFTLGADIWARSGFRCEYCGADILASPQAYMFAQSDHILPVSKYAQYRDDFNNYAHTCGMCNQLKRDWKPFEGEQPDLPTLISEDIRTDLIRRCRQHLKPLMQTKHSHVSRLREILLAYVDGEL